MISSCQVEIRLLSMLYKIFTPSACSHNFTSHRQRTFLNVFLTYPLPPNVLFTESMCLPQESHNRRQVSIPNRCHFDRPGPARIIISQSLIIACSYICFLPF